MKKIFLTAIAAGFLMFAPLEVAPRPAGLLTGFTFFVSRLNAQSQPVFTGNETVISLDFKDASLKDILKIFSMQSGLNFIASEAVQDRKVTLYLDKVPLSSAMDKIFSANNLSYDLDKKAGIFVVKEWGKMEIETVTKVFFLKFATVSTSSLKEELSKGMGSGSGAAASSGTSASSKTKWKEEGESGISSAVKKLLSRSGSLIEDFRTNSLIVTDTPMKMQVISQVIAALDVAIPQVMLEVEMLDVSKDAVDKIGFEFGDTPFTAIVTGGTASAGFFPYTGWTKLLRTSKSSLAINSGSNTYQMQLDYMKTLTDTKFLARPKLLTLNNETAEISITKDEIVGREDTTTFNNGVPTTTSVYARSTGLELTKEGTGIFLKVTPQINLEANEITMVINPKSSVSNISSLSNAANPQSDVEVRSTKSIVKVKDGETVVLGGLIHQDKSVAIKKLPLLGDIPLIGALFRHRSQTKDIERELIVFITPRIVRDKTDFKLARTRNMRLPAREQSSAFGSARDYIISSSMNKFDKKHN